MSGSIFIIREGSIVRLDARPYESEDVLQEMLASFPELIGAAGQSNGLLLIKREKTVPDEDSGSARWSLDHLFVDENGIPILVEVKRASDTRARREVVAQMLDYAANGVAYWPAAEFIEEFELSCRADGVEPNERLSNFLGDDLDGEEFWQRVEANLKAGRIRMVFVADVIPKELRRIIEFLNEQMRPAEVLAIEVAHFTDEAGTRTIVPGVIGKTARAASNKSASGSKLPPISNAEWIAQLAAKYGEQHGFVAGQIVEWAEQQGYEAAPTNTQDAIAISVQTNDGKRAWPLFVRRSGGRLEIAFHYLKSRPALADVDVRQRFLDEIQAIDGIQTTTSNPSGVPAIALDQMSEPSVLHRFLSVAHRMSESARLTG
ncbi:MAG: hypothetical protein TEF_18875 [Rhizobiales bacterium NRL2]|jgi:hypothetical protein|nr:MAG: hypothetical protein TEF_18875 [Rhizobiales bacterium NRL2]